MASLIQEQKNTHKKILESEEIVADLRNLLKEKDEVLNNIKKGAAEMRETRVSYTPSKDDSIDLALSKFINSQNDPQKLGALFLKEGKGVYQFGSKKVYVRIEGDKILSTFSQNENS